MTGLKNGAAAMLDSKILRARGNFERYSVDLLKVDFYNEKSVKNIDFLAFGRKIWNNCRR